jgi:hypothetical protein
MMKMGGGREKLWRNCCGWELIVFCRRIGHTLGTFWTAGLKRKTARKKKIFFVNNGHQIGKCLPKRGRNTLCEWGGMGILGIWGDLKD